MSDSEKVDISFLQEAMLMDQNKIQKHWVREIFGNGEENGAFNNLVQEVKLEDRQS